MKLGKQNIQADAAILKTMLPNWVYLQAPLTSTSWDGDAYSTTAKTKIDLSAVFGVPAGVRAVQAKTTINDSGSAGGTAYLVLSPDADANSGPFIAKASGFANDYIKHDSGAVPCDSAGDIYYQIAATGGSTMDVVLQIWGYLI